MRIPIFTDEVADQGGWHGAQLKRAFTNRGVETVFVSLKNCILDMSSDVPKVRIPDFDNIPSAAFVRGIAGGTLQQITMRLNVLHVLKMLGVQIYNDGKSIERTVDKAMTSFLLHHHGIATPNTWACESRQHAHEIMQQHAPLVIKPLFGSQGQGVRMVNATQLPLPMDTFVDGVFYLQRFIKAQHDYRVFVVNNQAIAAMRRTGQGWLHNVAQGAQCTFCTEEDVLAIALQAAKVLNIAYCGVDVIRYSDGKLLVLEVNSIPAWRGLQSVTSTNIAQVLADDVLRAVC